MEAFGNEDAKKQGDLDIFVLSVMNEWIVMEKQDTQWGLM